MEDVVVHHIYSIEDDLSEERSRYVIERLQTFNRPYLSDEPTVTPLEVYAVDDGGSIVGGLVAKTVWGWLEIAALWTEDKHRQKGLGSQLLQKAEDEARRRGCTAARLSTWDFQAREFYERRGYVSYGQLDGYPTEHTVYYLRKDLINSTD